MSGFAIAQQRLHNQRLTSPAFETAAEAVAWFGAVQGQDYLQSLWAIALRMPAATDATIEQAIAAGTIVRSWPMRGTIHYMAAADARWMLQLLAPRGHASISRRVQNLGLDEHMVAKAAAVVADALADGRPLPRTALYAQLTQAGIPVDNMRGLHLLGLLANELLICIGPRAGKQPTFVLLDAWVPPAAALPRDVALAQLAQRYFTSHGPATVEDFGWWGGLTMADARAGLEQARPQLECTTIEDRSYWHAGWVEIAPQQGSRAWLLPAFDEFFVAYRDRSAAASDLPGAPAANSIAVLNPTIVIDGRAVGHWKRTLERTGVRLTPQLFRALTADECAAYHAAAERYGRFLGAPVAQAL